MSKVVVVGSFMMDLVVKTDRRPRKGETVIGKSFDMFVGGKGFNQAVIAARLGAEVSMIGQIGTDSFGDTFMDALAKDRINSDFVVRNAEIGTGIGTPVIDADGDNSIIAIPRANMALSVENIDLAESEIASADVLLLQLEVPTDASQRAAEIAKANGAKVILNPAPASEFPDQFYEFIDILTPNETETEFFTNVKISSEDQAKKAAQILIEKGIEAVVLTLGDRGALLLTDDLSIAVSAYKVNVVDTTAAGDAFCGALAVALSRGDQIESAIRYANAAGALATTVLGAEPSMATADQINTFLNSQKE